MAIDPAQLETYTFDDIKKAAMQAIVTGLLTQSISGAGKTVTFGSVAEARATYDWAERAQQTASGQAGGRVRLFSRPL